MLSSIQLLSQRSKTLEELQQLIVVAKNSQANCIKDLTHSVKSCLHKLAIEVNKDEQQVIAIVQKLYKLYGCIVVEATSLESYINIIQLKLEIITFLRKLNDQYPFYGNPGFDAHPMFPGFKQNKVRIQLDELVQVKLEKPYPLLQLALKIIKSLTRVSKHENNEQLSLQHIKNRLSSFKQVDYTNYPDKKMMFELNKKGNDECFLIECALSAYVVARIEQDELISWLNFLQVSAKNKNKFARRFLLQCNKLALSNDNYNKSIAFSQIIKLPFFKVLTLLERKADSAQLVRQLQSTVIEIKASHRATYKMPNEYFKTVLYFQLKHFLNYTHGFSSDQGSDEQWQAYIESTGYTKRQQSQQRKSRTQSKVKINISESTELEMTT